MERKTKRLLYLAFGWLMFAIGFIGVFVPLLPTTPLMILALWGFSNGSESLHNWLYNHPKYGPTLRDWDQYRMIPVKAKVMSISMMSISAVIMIFFVDVPLIALICALGLMAYGAIYVLTKPSRIITPKPERKPQNIDVETQKQEPISPTPPQAP